MTAEKINALSLADLEQLIVDTWRVGVIDFRNLKLLEAQENRFEADLQRRLRGYAKITDASVCLFVDFCRELNQQQKTTDPPHANVSYRIFIARLINSFHAIRGSNLAARQGYPFAGFTILRNVFDVLVGTAATIRGITSFGALEGLSTDGNQDAKLIKRRRKEEEFKVQREAFGPTSNLPAETIAQLKTLDDVFDWETHGARLSMARNADWISGETSLDVSPAFKAEEYAMYLNRHDEISWMLHRLMPVAQLSDFSEEWKHKWRILNVARRRAVSALTTQLQKPIGAAFVNFVEAKFPFSEFSKFPDTVQD